MYSDPRCICGKPSPILKSTHRKYLFWVLCLNCGFESGAENNVKEALVEWGRRIDSYKSVEDYLMEILEVFDGP